MRRRLAVYSAVGVLALGVALVSFTLDWLSRPRTVEVTEYHAPRPAPDDELLDDRLDDKNPAFIPGLVDRRHEGDWVVNASAAVLKVDSPMLLPGDGDLVVLRPSYADAIAAAHSWMKVLPSINLIDGKAKQFDDGMLAAIDIARLKGWSARLPGDVSLVERLYQRLGPESVASPYLAAGLNIAGVDVRTARPDQASEWLRRFEANQTDSKPLGFYTWSDELTRAFRFRRFFQQRLPQNQGALITDLAIALGSDAKLLEDYTKVNAFQARLTNPPDTLTPVEAFPTGAPPGGPRPVSVFPSSRSKETELFRRLFPRGLPPDADLMRELIRAIRSGKVDLAPGPESGWYDHQVYALETFLMPEKGQEHAKLLLTRAYKKRMLEAFEALMTKRRETFAGGLAAAAPKSAEPPPITKLKPRLRVEPSPTYFLRMARSYDFVSNLLVSTDGEEGLAALHGKKESGERTQTLLEELRWMREFFYGLHLLSAEDIGMAPALRPDELIDRAACEAKASEWLSSFRQDPDLKVDTRVSVPLYFDTVAGRTRLWATIGVRLAKLDVSYARPPKVKPAHGPSDWREVTWDQLEDVEYVIAVDEFAECQIPGLQPFTRKEFREVCDTYKTKSEIVRALRERLL
jgi:hypothetical protein